MSDASERANGGANVPVLYAMISFGFSPMFAGPLVGSAFTLWLFPAQLHATYFAVYPALLFLAAPSDELLLVNRERLGSTTSLN